MFMHRLGSRCSCGVCLGSGADLWLSRAAELSVTLRVTERLTLYSDSFAFPLCHFLFFLLSFAVHIAKTTSFCLLLVAASSQKAITAKFVWPEIEVSYTQAEYLYDF